MAQRQSELGEYVEAVKNFSRNARLYMIHIVGMDMIHGTWEVLFNLYLLALFEPSHGVVLFGQHMHAIEFVGLRLAIGAVASGIVSLPAGLLSDRIGRKASFILGDGVGAVISLLNVLIVDPVFLLATPLVSSLAGSLHHVSETAFMAENSTKRERVHLFSVGGSLSTAVGIIGSLIAASFPAFVGWFGGQLPAYRAATLIGIALWFLSLIPALMLKEEKPVSTGGTSTRVKIGLGSIKHPAMVARLVTTGALLSVGYGAALPFMNVFFHEHLHADEAQIGTTFATASLFVAIGGLFAPIIASRLGRVRGITVARLAAVPVVLSLGLSPETAGEATIGLTAAGLAIALRSMLMNVSVPIAEAFAMEVLDPSERATMVGLESAAASLLRAGAVLVGSLAIASGDFFLPFAITALCYLLSTGLFWFWFRGHETPVPARAIVAPSWQT
ncbi:MAG TPA: MFS transporter [Chloroflexota bacterium]